MESVAAAREGEAEATLRRWLRAPSALSGASSRRRASAQPALPPAPAAPAAAAFASASGRAAVSRLALLFDEASSGGLGIAVLTPLCGIFPCDQSVIDEVRDGDGGGGEGRATAHGGMWSSGRFDNRAAAAGAGGAAQAAVSSLLPSLEALSAVPPQTRSTRGCLVLGGRR